MITAGIFHLPHRFTCCLLDETRRPRYLSAPRTEAARDAICRAMCNEDVDEIVVLQTTQGVDPVGELLCKERLDVWVVSEMLLDDLARVTRGHNCGPKPRAAILARMSAIPTWFAAMRPFTLRATPPTQLHLL
jgi:hypothetical protein